MDGPDATRRENRAPVTSRRAAIGRALRARNQVSDEPAFVSLSDDEQSNGLATFSAEDARKTESTFERVAGRVATSLPAVRDAIEPVTPEVPGPVWLAPLLAAGLVAAVVVFALLSVRVMRTTSDVRHTASSTPALKSPKAARDPRAIAVPHDVPLTAPPAAVSEKEPAPPIVAAAPASKPRDAVQAPAPEPRRVRPDPPIQAAVVKRPPTTPTTAAPRTLESPIAPPVESPTLPAVLDVEPRPVAAVPSSRPRAESSVAPARPPAPEAAIQTVLSRYRTAYQGLDAAAARAVWPSVDQKALSKAFERLEQQHLVFDACQISVGDAHAMASCVGTASYVPRAGSRVRHDDQRQWDFTLSKVDDTWLIDTVFAR